MLKTLILIVTSLTCWVAPVVAQTTDVSMTADARCVIVGARLAASTDPSQKDRATMLIVYYIGKLDGRASGLNLERLIVDQAVHMTSADYPTELLRCSEALAVEGQEITRIGNELTKLGK